MAWSAPMTAVANSVFTAAQFNQFVRDNLLETAPAKATTSGRHFVATGLNAIAERASATQFVGTSDTTPSTGYTDLGTPGPTVTCVTGTMAWVFTSAFANNNTDPSSTSFSHDITGATTSAASDNHRGVYVRDNTGSLSGSRFTVGSLRTGLTPGSNVFTMKYKVSGGTGTFSERSIAVLPL